MTTDTKGTITLEEFEAFEKIEKEAMDAEIGLFLREKAIENAVDVDGQFASFICQSVPFFMNGVIDFDGQHVGPFDSSFIFQSVQFFMRHGRKRAIERRHSGTYNFLDFYGRLTHWQSQRGQPDADQVAASEARRAVRVYVQATYDEHLNVLREHERRTREIHEENQRLARTFAETLAGSLQPSPAELTGLVMSLLERSREEIEPSGFRLIARPAIQPRGLHRTKRPEEIEKEVARNPILRAVTREIETLRERRECAPDVTPEDGVDLLKKEDAACVRQAFAYYWPEVFEVWKLDCRPTTLARFPAVLAVGPGALAPFFGHTVTGKTQQQKGSGQVEHLIVRNRGAQLSLRLPAGVVELPANPSSDQVLAAVASVTGNREFRFLGAILVAMNDDVCSGLVAPGGFYYRPGRFAELLGFGDGESTKMLDACLEALMCVSLTATLKVGGKELKVTAESLVIDGGGTIEARDTGQAGRRKAGRPKARLYRVQDFVLKLIGEGAAWFPLSKKALAPPDGVDQRKWDDAFKVYGVLGSLARLNKPRGNVWRNKVATILDTANITKKQARPSERVGRLKELCSHLRDAELITFNLKEEWLEFDLPSLRSSLEVVHAKRKTAKSLERAQV